MSIRINNIALKLDEPMELLEKKVSKKLKIDKKEIEEFKILKESIDARKKHDIKFNYILEVKCKNEKKLVQKLQIYANDISLLSNQSSAYVKGIIITSAHMAKGLEFDEVIIPQTDDKNYHSNIDKSMLYVAATRAMHKLTLTYSVSSPGCRFL